MGLFSKKETRSELNEAALDVVLRNTLNTAPVTKTEVLNIPAVAAGVEFISSTVAAIPIKLYAKDEKGNKHEIIDDYRLNLLNAETGDLLDSGQMKKSAAIDYLLDGAGYIFVNWRGNKIESLNYIEHSQVSVVKNEDPIFKVAQFLVAGKNYEDYKILRICRETADGVTGKGVIEKHGVLFRGMFNSLKYEVESLATGTKKGFLKSESKLAPDMIVQLKNAWQQLFKSSTSDTMILNKGISFEGVSSTAAELQQNENKITNTSDVYSIFGINDDLFSVSTSSKDAYINSIKTAVFPVISAMETAFNKFLLLETEKNNKFFVFDTKAIMKGDILNRFKAYEVASKEGFLTMDEIRREENYAPLGVDKIKLSLGTVFYSPETGEIININTNSIMKTEGGGSGEGGNQEQ